MILTPPDREEWGWCGGWDGGSSSLRALGCRVVIQTQDQPTISFALAVGKRREVCVSVDKSEESQRLTGHNREKNRANANK